jgi:hypothetical protein
MLHLMSWQKKCQWNFSGRVQLVRNSSEMRLQSSMVDESFCHVSVQQEFESIGHRPGNHERYHDLFRSYLQVFGHFQHCMTLLSASRSGAFLFGSLSLQGILDSETYQIEAILTGGKLALVTFRYPFLR